jgi:hypothetical protein
MAQLGVQESVAHAAQLALLNMFRSLILPLACIGAALGAVTPIPIHVGAARRCFSFLSRRQICPRLLL